MSWRTCAKKITTRRSTISAVTWSRTTISWSSSCVCIYATAIALAIFGNTCRVHAARAGGDRGGYSDRPRASLGCCQSCGKTPLQVNELPGKRQCQPFQLKGLQCRCRRFIVLFGQCLTQTLHLVFHPQQLVLFGGRLPQQNFQSNAQLASLRLRQGQLLLDGTAAGTDQANGLQSLADALAPDSTR